MQCHGVLSGIPVLFVGILLSIKWLFIRIWFISVSNEVPEHPCVSPVSNQVFERRLIEKYIAENGTDPMNGQPLSEEQLVDIKGNDRINKSAHNKPSNRHTNMTLKSVSIASALY